uniref:Aminotransferase-like plant mobile domain-containing protein n=1 Tax=Fagus sylvatica TaxID=28930 RepID=A0A2N9GQD5_FAGSY
MVVFVDSSKTPKNQFITILSHADEPIEEGITLAVLPSTSVIYSSSPIDVNRTPHLSHWWSESSRELYDPSKRDSHPVQSKIFTLRSSLHSVVPSAKEMSSLPSSCEYLFAAFHHLSLELGGPDSVTSTDWVGFWFRGSVRYPKPPNRRSLRRSVASSMARGKKYYLAIPVLATIYKGLNDISSSSVPSKCDTTFPAHYLNAWLAEYFATHFDLPEASPLDPCMVRFSGKGAAKYFEEAEARKLFRSITKFKFHCLALFKGHQEILEDNDQLSDSYVNYFISQRPSYLSSRRGDLSVLEPYSPHRFGRQFGFTQDIPGEIKEDLRTAPLERVMHLWDRCLPTPVNRMGNIGPSKLIVKLKRRHESDEPSEHREDNKLSLRISEGTDETSGIVSTFRGADRAMASHAKKLNEEDGISCSDHGNEVGVDSLKEVDKRQSPADGSPSMSEFSVQGLETFDLATKDRVWKFMENTSQYSSIRSALKQRVSLEVKNQRRADTERRHTLALKSEAIEARDSSIAEAELSKVLSRETELRKELELLVTQRGKLENSISLHEEKLPQLQAAVSRIKEEISEIEATPTLETSDHAKLQELRELLETSRRGVEELRLDRSIVIYVISMM